MRKTSCTCEKVVILHSAQHSDIMKFRSITTNIHLIAKSFTDVIGWATIATQIKRAQIHDRRDQHCRWVDYSANRFAWVTFNAETDSARFVGVGVQPNKQLSDDELLIRFDVPFEGCGRTVREKVADEVARAFRRKRRAS